jgi:hypothetical protein
MMYRSMADLILLSHFAFALFALFGGLLVLRYRKLLWLHLAALLWAVVVQWANLVCPLTPLENLLRQYGGQTGYEAGFIEHYVSMLLYPDNLTLELRYVLGLVLIAVNAAIYGYILMSRRRSRRSR